MHSVDDDMKIFSVAANYPEHNIEPGMALYDNVEPVLLTMPDSALLKDGKPFFVPDWCASVDLGASLAVRICRLGKSIPERFAHRYYDAVTVGVAFTARDVLTLGCPALGRCHRLRRLGGHRAMGGQGPAARCAAAQLQPRGGRERGAAGLCRPHGARR